MMPSAANSATSWRGLDSIVPVSFTFTPEERRVFQRPPYNSVSECAAQVLIVQDGMFKGSPLRLDVSPFLVQPMDSYSDPLVDEVGVCGSLQVGKTLFLYACIAYSILCRSSVRMLSMPTGKALEKVVDEKLAPLISGSPALKKRLAGKIRRAGMRFKDGTPLLLASAETPSDRASITVQDLFLDEEDLYMPGATSADPVSDFRGRTNSLGWLRKIARCCQPKGEHSSIFNFITREAGQLFCYETRCPACGEYRLPRVDNIVLIEEPDRPADIRERKLARYRCECGYEWSDHIRDLAVQQGRYMPYKYSAERGFEPSHRVAGAKSHGYHIPAILSRFVSLSDIAAKRLNAEQSDDPQVKQQYYNDVLGLPYAHVEIMPDIQMVESRRVDWLPQRVVPYGAAALTCGIDMQKHGFWFLAMAWMPNMSSYIIDNGWLRDWNDVYDYTHNTWYPVQAQGFPGYPGQVLPDGREHPLSAGAMPFWRCAIDTGGTEKEGDFTATESAYDWVRAYGDGIVWAAKGASRQMPVNVRESVIDKMPHSNRAIPGGLRLMMLDTWRLKALALRRLQDPEAKTPTRIYCNPQGDPGSISAGHIFSPEHGFVHPNAVAGTKRDVYSLSEQLTSERLVRENGKMVWKLTKSQNHYLDCFMLNQACVDASWSPSLPVYLLQQRRAMEAANAPSQTPVRHTSKERKKSGKSRFER
ncbi:phage terminase large subunit family protein [Desulfovibrio sp. OttesenSCG-928-C06]|nr:phage terminase large subunit family protein [Desulfovibrio sp. OttesenSCG-928-C06]